jgi:hypothetical protein
LFVARAKPPRLSQHPSDASAKKSMFPQNEWQIPLPGRGGQNTSNWICGATVPLTSGT